MEKILTFSLVFGPFLLGFQACPIPETPELLPLFPCNLLENKTKQTPPYFPIALSQLFPSTTLRFPSHLPPSSMFASLSHDIWCLWRTLITYRSKCWQVFTTWKRVEVEGKIVSSLCLAEMYEKSTLISFACFSLPPKAQSHGPK